MDDDILDWLSKHDLKFNLKNYSNKKFRFGNRYFIGVCYNEMLIFRAYRKYNEDLYLVKIPPRYSKKSFHKFRHKNEISKK